MGREATAGTAVAASTIWLGTVTMVDETAVTFIDESIGVYGGYGRTYIPKEGALINFESVPASYEQILHVFEGGVQTVSASGTGGTWTYSYAMSSTQAHTIKTYTLEVGDSEDAEEAEYCFCESFGLSGSYDEAVTLTSTWRGRQVSTATFTASLSKPSTEVMVFNTGLLYIDNDTGTIGTNLVSDSFRSFSLDVTTGWVPVQTADGALYFTFAKISKPEVVLSITAEHTSDWDSAGEKAKWRALTPRQIRVKFDGSGPRYMNLDLAGKWETFSAIEESDGNSVLTGTFRGFYSTTAALFFESVVCCAISSVP
jgi:hypothetical protein